MQHSNKIEQDLVNYYIDKIKRCARAENISCDFVQIETGATAIGIPDALMFLGPYTFWIEFKRMQTWGNAMVVQNKAKNIKGKLKFRPGQLRMLHRLTEHNEKAFVCALSESQDAIYIHPRQLPMEGGVESGIPSESTLYDLPSIWEGLKTFLTEEFQI